MMMWIVLGIVAYIAIACVTFIASAEETNFLSAILTAVVWPLLVIFAALFALFSTIASITGYAIFALRQTFRKKSRV